MKFLSHPLIFTWLLTVMMKIAVLALLSRRGIVRKYPGLGLYLAGTVALSLYRLYGGLSSRTGYYDAYIATQWVQLLLYGVLVLDAYWAMARRFPRVLAFASAMAGAYGTLAAGAAWLLAGMHVPHWADNIASVIATSRNVTLTGTLFLMLARWWWFSSASGACANVRRYVDGAILLLAGQWLVALLFRILGPVAGNINYAMYAVTTAALIVWGTLHAGGESWQLAPAPTKDPRGSLEDLIRRGRDLF